MPLNRRQFIQITAALGLLTTGGLAIEVSTWWNTPASAPFQHLNEPEARVVNALGGAAFPSGDTIELSGTEAGLDRFFDTVLGAMTNENRILLKLLLETIDHYTLVSHGTHFSQMHTAERQHLIEQWLQHDNHLFRGAIQSIIVFLGMGYTAHPTASAHLSQYFRCGFGA
jgi:hypothetical protein